MREAERIPAVLIIPGGAFRRLVYNFEGEDVAKWLNSMGIAAFVLECRLHQMNMIMQRMFHL